MSDTAATPAIFGKEQLQRAIDAELNRIPATARGAEISICGGDGWVEVRFAFRVADEWQIGGLIKRERGGTTYGATVRRYWGGTE